MIVQVPGVAIRISRSRLEEALRSSMLLNKLLLAYARFQILQADPLLLSAARRPLPARLAALILMCGDRLDETDIEITHEDLATTLGVRRAGVTVALASFVTSGAVQNRKRRISIKNR